MSAGNSRSIKNVGAPMPRTISSLWLRQPYLGCSSLCTMFRVVAARVLGQWRRLERESVVEPFCRSDFGRHPVHDARGPAAQAKLDVSENSGAGDFRRSGYHPADDTSANPDDRSALAAFRRRGDRLSAVVAGVEETQYV